MPIINGALETPLFGKLFLTNGVSCSYRIQFDGKSAAEDQVFEFADYQIKWQCVLGKSTLAFKTPMFLTEGPFRGTSKRLHQITIDILGLAGNMESVLSTHILWDREQAQVKFDSVTIKQFVRPSKVKAIRANNVTEALHGSIKIAAKAWNGPLWDAIIRTHQNTEN